MLLSAQHQEKMGGKLTLPVNEAAFIILILLFLCPECSSSACLVQEGKNRVQARMSTPARAWENR